MRRFVVATGNWVTGLDPKGWSVMHRLHHQYSDTALDPHSPTHYGVFGVMMGQLNSYKKVLRGLIKNDPDLMAVAADLDFPVSKLNQKKLWLLPYALHVAIAFAIGALVSSWFAGFAYYAGIMSHPIQGWMVNSLGHKFGYRTFDVDDDSKNNTLVALLVFGEGYQNNHHRFPRSAKFALTKGEIDQGYWLCKALAAFGLIEILGEAKPAEVALAAHGAQRSLSSRG